MSGVIYLITVYPSLLLFIFSTTMSFSVYLLESLAIYTYMLIAENYARVYLYYNYIFILIFENGENMQSELIF